MGPLHTGAGVVETACDECGAVMPPLGSALYFKCSSCTYGLEQFRKRQGRDLGFSHGHLWSWVRVDHYAGLIRPDSICKITYVESGRVVYAGGVMSVCNSKFKYIQDTVTIEWE